MLFSLDLNLARSDYLIYVKGVFSTLDALTV